MKFLIIRASEGKSSIAIVMLAVALVLALSSALGISLPKQVEEDLVGVKTTFEEGLEIIRSKSYKICSNVKLNEIQAAGIKITETSLKGFFQICERLVLNLGNLQIYADFEARVMWVYSDTSNGGADTEAYYVQFT
jgi:hypothetical protein